MTEMVLLMGLASWNRLLSVYPQARFTDLNWLPEVPKIEAIGFGKQRQQDGPFSYAGVKQMIHALLAGLMLTNDPTASFRWRSGRDYLRSHGRL